MRIDATMGVAYYPFMAPMPQWELPHTKVEQAHRTVGLLHKDFHYSVKNQKLISNAIPFEYIDVPLPADSQKLNLTMEVISIERSTYEELLTSFNVTIPFSTYFAFAKDFVPLHPQNTSNYV